MISAAGFAVATMLSLGRGIGYACRAALNLCRRDANERFLLTGRHPLVLEQRYVAFCDGERFAVVPWGMLGFAAMELGVRGPRSGPWIHCRRLVPGAVALDPATFDRLLGEPLDPLRGE